MPLTIIPIEQAPAHLGRQSRLMGIDLGTKTIGLALSDLGRSLASPLTIIGRKKFAADATALLEATRANDVAVLVMGLPLNMDGSEGPRAQSTRAFLRSLTPLTDLPIILWDERLSTVAAEREMIALDVSRAKRKAVIDAAAAAYILQGVLDALRRIERERLDRN